MRSRSPNLSGPESSGPLCGVCPPGPLMREFLRDAPEGWTISSVSTPHAWTIAVLPP
mgnify:CR=1 FL=1